MQRRGFLAAGMAGAGAMAIGSVWSQASPPNFGLPTPASPGFRSVKVGAVEVFALQDGIARRPLGEEFVTNAPLEQVKALLATQKLPTDYVDIPFTPFLVVDGGTRYLIDTGFADNGPPGTGRLRTHLAAAGFKPEDIQDVIVSHYHGDHINGLRLRDGTLAFPNAKVHVSAPEHAFWMDDARMEAAPQAARGGFMAARRVFGSLPADRLVRFEPGSQVAPGIRSLEAFGHTPGMSAFVVRSQGQSFTYVADVTNVPALFARNPDWSVTFDMNADQARQTRRRIFEMLARERSLAGGFHFPFPAFGTIEQAGSGFQFRPAA